MKDLNSNVVGNSDYILSGIVTTVRHGHKDELGVLSGIGIEQAKKEGDKLHYLEGETLLFHSGVDRVVKTVDTLYGSRNSAKDKFVNAYESHYLHYLYDPSNKGSLFSEWDKVELDPNVKMDKFLNMRDHSPEPDVFPSPKGMAIRLARVILTQIDFCTITIPEIMTNFVNGSHEPVIMSFLFYYLNSFEPQIAEPFSEKIGGSIDFY